MIEPTIPKYSHEATYPAVLLMLKDGKIQKAVLYGSTGTVVYVREEGRGGFGIVPAETATDFLAFDDLLTLEQVPAAAVESQLAASPNGSPVLAITVKAQ